MAKFYITCGSFEYLTTAQDTRSAALWAIHQYLSDRVELSTVQWTDAETIDRQDLIEAMLDLKQEITVSEIGFGRDEAATFDTADILSEWNQLVVAIQRMEAILEGNQ